jgi:outer membrane protein TolC
VQLPLFHGAGARIRAAATARDEAAAAVLARQAQILHQLDGARTEYAQRYAAWRQLATAAHAAEQRAAQAEAQRTAGRIDRPAVLAARAAADQAALAAAVAEGAALTTLAQLEDAVQRPLWPVSHLPAAAALAESITTAAPAPTGEAHDR